MTEGWKIVYVGKATRKNSKGINFQTKEQAENFKKSVFSNSNLYRVVRR